MSAPTEKAKKSGKSAASLRAARRQRLAAPPAKELTDREVREKLKEKYFAEPDPFASKQKLRPEIPHRGPAAGRPAKKPVSDNKVKFGPDLQRQLLEEYPAGSPERKKLPQEIQDKLDRIEQNLLDSQKATDKAKSDAAKTKASIPTLHGPKDLNTWLSKAGPQVLANEDAFKAFSGFVHKHYLQPLAKDLGKLSGQIKSDLDPVAAKTVMLALVETIKRGVGAIVNGNIPSPTGWSSGWEGKVTGPVKAAGILNHMSPQEQTQMTYMKVVQTMKAAGAAKEANEILQALRTAGEIEHADDEHAMTDLALYIENERALHNQQQSILLNLLKKMKKNTYDPELAPKLWQHWVDAGAKMYVKEFGNPGDLKTVFPVALRKKLAEQMAKDYEAALKAGEYDYLLEKKAAPSVDDVEIPESEVTFSVHIEPEVGDPKDHFDDDAQAQWVHDQLDAGNEWAWCQVLVEASYGDYLGVSSWLGACSYENKKQFIETSGYYDDLKQEAMADLQEKVNDDLRKGDQADEDATTGSTKTAEADADDLELFIDNTSELYNQKTSIVKNVMRRLKKKTYDPELAVKLWMYLVDAGAKMYAKQMADDESPQKWSDMFPKAVREQCARAMAEQALKEIKHGDWEWVNEKDAATTKVGADVETIVEQLTQSGTKAQDVAPILENTMQEVVQHLNKSGLAAQIDFLVQALGPEGAMERLVPFLSHHAKTAGAPLSKKKKATVK